MRNNYYFFRLVLLLAAAWLLCLQGTYAQASEIRTPRGVKIIISSNRGKICEMPLAYIEEDNGSFPVRYRNVNSYSRELNELLKRAFEQVSRQRYFRARVGEEVTITIETIAKDTSFFFVPGGPYQFLAPPSAFNKENYSLGDYYGNHSTEASGNEWVNVFRRESVLEVRDNFSGKILKTTQQIKFTFLRGGEQAWVYLALEEGCRKNCIFNQQDQERFMPTKYYNLVLPFIVEGVIPEEVPILGTVTEPQVPYLVLHDPPGDGSFTEFQTTETTCRSLETNSSTDESNSYNANVKIGVKGSIGLIATVDYEVYAEIRGSGATGNVQIQSNTRQTCVTISKGFATADAPDGSDVFIGYGMDVNYGVFRTIVVDTNICGGRIDSALLYAPIPGTVRQFVYTKEGIEADIAALQRIIADSVGGNPNDRAKIKIINDAQNQIEAWKQVLQLNEANKNDLNAPPLFENISFSGGAGPISRESSIEITDTKTITTENYIDGAFGLQGVVNIGGSGFSGGYEYKTQKRFGETTTQSGTAAKNVRYTFRDDDAGDKFNVDVVRDPMYGTPAFRIKSGTISSCPYEGGYQRDQPKLRHDGETADTLTKQGVPVGSSATFKLDLCNESNEARTYNLKLNAQSNLNGAVVTAAGVPLNGNDLGQTFTVPANSCVQDLVLEVRQLSATSPLAYPNLEIFMYSPCDEEITSSVFASVYFGNATSTKEIGDASLLSVFPNQTSSQLRVTLAGDDAIESYQLSDLTGKTLHQVHLKNALQQTDLDLSTLPKGMYLLQVRSGERVYAKKVLVQ
ncbi:MAG: T9SS type A sorting domain-containing protein [Saprospiraceae bacterium]